MIYPVNVGTLFLSRLFIWSWNTKHIKALAAATSNKTCTLLTPEMWTPVSVCGHAMWERFDLPAGGKRSCLDITK